MLQIYFMKNHARLNVNALWLVRSKLWLFSSLPSFAVMNIMSDIYVQASYFSSGLPFRMIVRNSQDLIGRMALLVAHTR